MSNEVLTTIITGLIQGGGLATYFWFVIKGLRDTIKEQKNTLAAMEQRISETHKIYELYKTMINDLPSDIDRFQEISSKLKDSTIKELEKAVSEKDDALKKVKEENLSEFKYQEKLFNQIIQPISKLLEDKNNNQRTTAVTNSQTITESTGIIYVERIKPAFVNNENKIALKAFNNKYVCTECGKTFEVVANRTRIDIWETYDLIKLPNNLIALCAYNGKYVAVQNDEQNTLVANQTEISESTSFQIIDLGNNLIALKYKNEKYVSVGLNHQILTANKSKVSEQESFLLINNKTIK